MVPKKQIRIAQLVRCKVSKSRNVENITTSTELHHFFEYEAVSGRLKWKNPTSRRNKPGSYAGCQRKDGYWIVALRGALLYAHRVIWCMSTGEWPKYVIDHIDRDPSNNRIENLRDVEEVINSINKNIRKNNKTGKVGVYVNSQGDYVAQITIEYKTTSLGTFRNIDDAVAIREKHMRSRMKCLNML